MALTHICAGRCYKCTAKMMGPDWEEKGKSPAIRTFHLVRALFTISAHKRAEVIDCWECQECGELVPHDSWHTYQKTGNVVVRQPGRRN